MKREKYTGQYQYQENIIKGQSYLYSAGTPENVMIGTSLSNRLNPDSLHNVYSLSLSGLNVFDGLHIVLAKKEAPHNVFIEYNYFYKPENKSFVSLFDSKAGNILRKNLVALRASNQPVGVLRNFLGSLLHSPKKADNAPVTETVVSQDIFSQLLALQARQYSAIDTNQVSRSLDLLEEEVAELTARGSKVCLFEMPVSPELECLPLANYVRTVIADRFSAAKNVVLLKLPARNEYQTLDGVHLNSVSAAKYTLYFKTHLTDPI